MDVSNERTAKTWALLAVLVPLVAVIGFFSVNAATPCGRYVRHYSRLTLIYCLVAIGLAVMMQVFAWKQFAFFPLGLVWSITALTAYTGTGERK